MSGKFYVTTPIYYVNDIPHIGHAYTTVAADILARYHRMKGEEVFFLTGTDEHGQKVEEAASERGLSPKGHADLMVGNFKALWERLGISYDAFIRTTDEGHKTVVRELLLKLKEKGEIEKRAYSGWYCTPDERFWTQKDITGGKCPDCGRRVEPIEEENYFFLMSKYQTRLIKHIEENPSYIQPETRRNEVMGFLKGQPLGDLCISRPKQRLSWGIPLPFDEEFVTYVWFDALVNYYSATTYLAGPREGLWPANRHIIGKDILTTHAVYWSSMLMALGMPLPENIFAHGWWTVEGRKMSKSLGNMVEPGTLSETYGADALRYFLMREVTFGLDGDFSEEALIKRINTDLANDIGNLASRTLKMAERYFGSEAPKPEAEDAEMKSMAEGVLSPLDECLKGLRFGKALDEIWRLLSYANRYIDSSAPWKLARDEGERGRLATVIYSSLEAIRFLTLYLYPFMPSKMTELRRMMGLEGGREGLALKEEAVWGRLRPGTRLSGAESLFPRIEAKEAKGSVPPPAPSGENLISVEYLRKVEIKVGRIVGAERLKGSDKLIRLDVDTGEKRQLVAGIGKHYSPDGLLGKEIVVVTNLKPAKLMGVESQGMLLAASDAEGRLSILTVETKVSPGAVIS